MSLFDVNHETDARDRGLMVATPHNASSEDATGGDATCGNATSNGATNKGATGNGATTNGASSAASNTDRASGGRARRTGPAAASPHSLTTDREIVGLVEQLVSGANDAAGDGTSSASADRAAHEPEAARADRIASALWTVLAEPGDLLAGRARRVLGAAAAAQLLLAHAGIETWLRGFGDEADDCAASLPSSIESWRRRLDRSAFVDALHLAVRTGQQLVVPGDRLWPAQLDALGDGAPAALWGTGRLDLLARAPRAIGIVGTRAASGYGVHVTGELVDGLVRAGCATVSGGAYGIDGVAHRATLACEGDTIAVLAGGLDRPSPAGHAEMFRHIARSGLVIAEAPSGMRPSRWRFLQRNRVIAALSAAVVVVEAGWRSGSINTAHHAAAIGRPIGAVPGPVTSPASAGCHRLVREGIAELVTDAADVVALVDGEASDGAWVPRDNPDEVRLLDALDQRRARTAEALARESGLSLTDVEALLAVLELDGTVMKRPSGWTRAPTP